MRCMETKPLAIGFQREPSTPQDADSLDGGPGADVLDGDSGSDVLRAGRGGDTVLARDRTSR